MLNRKLFIFPNSKLYFGLNGISQGDGENNVKVTPLYPISYARHH